MNTSYIIIAKVYAEKLISRHPVSHELLPAVKEISFTKANVVKSENAIRLMKSELGAKLVSFTDIARKLAAALHDDWSKTRLENGWVWGPETDNDNKVHRDLLPFEVLLADPDLTDDCEDDVNTAKEMIIATILEADIFPAISVDDI